jgi:hypothetical protein
MFKAKISHFFIMRANDHRVLDCVCLRQKLVISLNRQKSLHFLTVMAPTTGVELEEFKMLNKDIFLFLLKQLNLSEHSLC